LLIAPAINRRADSTISLCDGRKRRYIQVVERRWRWISKVDCGQTRGQYPAPPP